MLKCNLQTQTDYLRNSVNTNKQGINSLRFFASKVWQIILTVIKKLKSLEGNKNNIKKLERNEDDCKFAKTLYLVYDTKKICFQFLSFICGQ